MSRDEALSVLKDPMCRSAGIRKAFLRDCSEIIVNDDTSFRCYTNRWRSPILSKQDRKTRIDEINKLINELSNQYEAKKAEIMKIKEDIKTIPCTNHDPVELQLSVSKMKSRFDEIESELLDEPGKEHLKFFERELVTIKSSIDALKDEEKQEKSREAEHRVRLNQLQDKYVILRAAYRKVKDEIENTEKALAVNIEKLEQIRSQQVEIRTLLAEVIKKSEEKENEIVRLVEDLEILEKEAIEYSGKQECPDDIKINTRSVDEIQRRIETLNRKISQMQIRRVHSESVETAKERIDDLSRVIQSTEGVLERNASLFVLLGQMLTERRMVIQDFRNQIAARCKLNFEHFLRCRSMRGSLEFDHVEKRLKIQIQPFGDNENYNSRETKRDLCTLSGGERSYGTVCLLIAMWSISRNPFRFMDEYDVFMDCVNRSTATTLLLEAAAEINDTQFIFMTPLSIEGIDLPEEKGENKIFRMPKM
ncbi:hypothetical protein ACOME3_002135 [Neoechinorhynchus agilis]